MNEQQFLVDLDRHGYSLEKEIGRGGYSVVYLIVSQKYNTKFVAKKILKQAGKTYSESEIDILLRLSHTNIIRFYESFHSGDNQVIILEYCPNGSLATFLDENEQLSLQQFYNITHQITQAIKYCHDNGVSHCDIKPENILLDSYGRSKLTDFGIAQISEVGVKIKKFDGSLPYMAPELLNKIKHDPFATDIWSLGVTFFVILFKKLPWSASGEKEMLYQITRGLVCYPTTIDEKLYGLFNKMICVNPSKRYKIDQVLKVLETLKEQYNHKTGNKDSGQLIQIKKPEEDPTKISLKIKAVRTFLNEPGNMSQRRRRVSRTFAEQNT
ncbi:Serine/threonine-protein kinase Aurora-3 [Tritrichomonas foetus]|uniref:Serine/threonine-protein kinase Aurora-3 n=1 Tax=Tritrichomonas foetus TaxID=1144522 RepID=A0A1J4K6E1_9EUKA|nr:Serine/threonine-protein kinase Aurora-3 [Tritrichomonas foetus]|eukprot:OHT06747.1 Serine/threonine-protein kinase Aurora-3 [Tritrichomonas foetus]